jgi:hypothetical protein
MLKISIFASPILSEFICVPSTLYLVPRYMECVAQLVRAPDCGSGGRGFEPHHAPSKKGCLKRGGLFLLNQ